MAQTCHFVYIRGGSTQDTVSTRVESGEPGDKQGPLTAIWLACAELSMLPPAETSETRDAIAAMVAVNFIFKSVDWIGWRNSGCRCRGGWRDATRVCLGTSVSPKCNRALGCRRRVGARTSTLAYTTRSR